MTALAGRWKRDFRRYDKLIDQSDLFHRVVFPRLLESIGDSSPVLDFGGGSGKLLSLIPQRSEAVLYDPNAFAIDEAAKLGRLQQPQRQGVSVLDELPLDHFAHVVMCFVLMSLPTELLERQTLAAARRVMRPGAKIDIVVTDPLHRAERFSCFETDFTRGRPYDAAARNVPFTVRLHGRSTGDYLEIPNFHRPLAITLDSIQSAGLTVSHISSLPDFNANGWYNPSANPYLLIAASLGPGT